MVWWAWQFLFENRDKKSLESGSQNSERYFSAMGLVRGIGRRSWSLWPQPLRGLPGLPCHVRKEQLRVVHSYATPSFQLTKGTGF